MRIDSLLVSFVSLCYKFLPVKHLHHNIHQFYPICDHKDLHFSDVKGNVFHINNAKFNLLKDGYDDEQNLIYSKIKHINNFQQHYKYRVLNFHAKNETTLIETPDNKLFFEWKDSTCMETVDNFNEYLRLNHFGQVFKYNLLRNEINAMNMNPYLARDEYIQKACYSGDLLWIINNSNVLKVFSFENKSFRLLLSYPLNRNFLVQKFDIKNHGNFFQLLLLFSNGQIDLFTFHFRNGDVLKFYNKNSIKEENVVDIDYISNIVICMKRKSITIYYYDAYKPTTTLITSQYIEDCPSFTSIIWFQNKLILNGNKEGLPYIQIDTDFKKLNETLTNTIVLKQ